ncbi:transposase [Vibrio crassostreae]|nr:hypothetical protein EDB37_100821 [Vibrio crassostreae]CAK2419592.1 transposase [Vibrio crassostreae]CAK2425600.1 transposase [Vibrio crassostreae]CAK3644203.1 transposase [Vibrio crassostreae]CAK3813794.1 transposase [Vibrio crassostreae]
MEGSSGVHHWARELLKLGYNPKIIASEFVIPYRQNEKNDANDAEVICEAVSATINQLRDLLSEFGIAMPQSRYSTQNTIGSVLEDAENGLPRLA